MRIRKVIQGTNNDVNRIVGYLDNMIVEIPSVTADHKTSTTIPMRAQFFPCIAIGIKMSHRMIANGVTQAVGFESMRITPTRIQPNVSVTIPIANATIRSVTARVTFGGRAVAAIAPGVLVGSPCHAVGRPHFGQNVRPVSTGVPQ